MQGSSVKLTVRLLSLGLSLDIHVYSLRVSVLCAFQSYFKREREARDGHAKASERRGKGQMLVHYCSQSCEAVRDEGSRQRMPCRD